MHSLDPYREQIYALLRIISGLMFASHGGQKVLGLFGGAPPDTPVAILYIAGLIELVGGLMIAAGFFTRVAAFLSSGLMAAAYFMVHQAMGPLPIQNQGELAVLYCWVFLYFAARGDGIWSVGGDR